MSDPTSQPILENLWWVIPGKLAGVRQPTAEELPDLQAAGVGAIVSVFHEETNLELYYQSNIPFIWLPIAIDSTPASYQLEEFQKFVSEQNLLDHGVVVHCSTGRHRTGTILAAYLIGNGASYKSAMQTILEANPTIKLPETQDSFLRKLPQK